jgi:hypothetical protein
MDQNLASWHRLAGRQRASFRAQAGLTFASRPPFSGMLPPIDPAQSKSALINEAMDAVDPGPPAAIVPTAALPASTYQHYTFTAACQDDVRQNDWHIRNAVLIGTSKLDGFIFFR